MIEAILRHESPPLFLPSGKNVGPYTIGRVLGHGANGIAYLAHDKTLDRKVVLKEHYPLYLCARDSVTHRLVPMNEETEPVFVESVNQFTKKTWLFSSEWPHQCRFLQSHPHLGEKSPKVRYLQNHLSRRHSPGSENLRQDKLGNLEVTMQSILKIKLTQ